MSFDLSAGGVALGPANSRVAAPTLAMDISAQPEVFFDTSLRFESFTTSKAAG